MKLYLAGPDVFRPDALAWADAARAQVAVAGHQALVPLDNEACTATGIYQANLALIAEADAVLANLNPFRGLEPDSGTCFEVGYALALGKRVVAYLADARPQAEKLLAPLGPFSERDGRLYDRMGWGVEHFGLPVNLMLGASCTVVEGDLGQALAALNAA